MDFSGYPGNQPPAAESGIAYPLAISRSVSDIQEIIAFYQEVFDVQYVGCGCGGCVQVCRCAGVTGGTGV